MTSVLREVLQLFRTSPIFGLFALLTLAVSGVIGLITFDVIDMGMTHFGEQQHRVHDLTFGFLFTTAAVGIAAQLRRPASHIAGMAMAVIPWAALLLAGGLANDISRVVVRNPSTTVAPLTLIVALLHPAGRSFFRPFRLQRLHRGMLALVVVAAVPLLLFAATNIRLQATAADEHANMGHYGFMAALAITVVAVGILASLRPHGWKLAAWTTGLLPALLALSSLVYPVSSSLSIPWAVAAILWGAGFILTAARSPNPGPRAPPRGPTIRAGSTAARP